MPYHFIGKKLTLIWLEVCADWTMSTAKALEPIYTHMKKELLIQKLYSRRETTLKIINDNGKDSNSKKIHVVIHE